MKTSKSKPYPSSGKLHSDTRRVYYLTSTQYAISNIALRRIKVSRFSDLNDPFELIGVDRSDLANRKAFRKQTVRINDETGLLCFSKAWSNPVMWGHYAEKHAGVCMGFDIPEKDLCDVLYVESFKPIKLDPKTRKPKLTDDAIGLLKRTKFVDWKYEEETRLFVELQPLTSESGKYFLPFSKSFVLRELILGPRCELSIDAVRGLVDSKVVTVKKARLAFSRFAVVVDKKESR
jgi:hypothetical protein